MAPRVGLGVRFDGNERGDRYVDDSVITTKVKAAILNGSTLRSQADIDQAVKVARGVASVKSVKSDMRIK